MAEQTGTKRLNTRQYRFLLAAAQEGVDPSISAVCKRSGVSRSQFYRWMRKDEAFIQAWNDLPHMMFAGQMPNIIKVVVMKALAGDPRMLELALKYGLREPPKFVKVDNTFTHEHVLIQEADRQGRLARIMAGMGNGSQS